MKLVFFGAPGAGKGTQAEIVSEKLGIPAVSTGAIIRKAIKDGTKMGLAAKDRIEKGELVPDDVVIGIIKDRLAEKDCENGFILDGFPRTVPQAEALDKMGVAIDVVLDLEVSDEKIIARMSGRRTCAKCGATYHTLYKAPAKENVCDVCGETLTTRKDDAPEVVKSRLGTYHKETEPLKGYYVKKGILKTVVGQEELSETTKLTLAALGIN